MMAVSLKKLRQLGFDRSYYDRSSGCHRVRCSQCEALVINGIPCHETGCPSEFGLKRKGGETVKTQEELKGIFNSFCEGALANYGKSGQLAPFLFVLSGEKMIAVLIDNKEAIAKELPERLKEWKAEAVISVFEGWAKTSKGGVIDTSIPVRKMPGRKEIVMAVMESSHGVLSRTWIVHRKRNAVRLTGGKLEALKNYESRFTKDYFRHEKVAQA